MAARFFSRKSKRYGGIMPKTVTIKITYDNQEGNELPLQEIKETIDGLRNSLLSQVSGLKVNIIEK